MDAFSVIDSRYRALYDRAAEVLGADPRVLAFEPGGSIATGEVDQWSDLDLHIAVGNNDFDAFVADWPQWLKTITATVFARTPLFPSIINTVTADGLTFDIVVYRDAIPAFKAAAGYPVGSLARQPFPDQDQALQYAVEEQLRGLAGPFITLVQRGEHLRHLTGAPHIVGLLMTVLLAETRSPPAGKRWNASLSSEQLAAVEALPALRATREAVIAFGLEVAHQIITRSRPLFVDYGLAWPSDLAAVASTRLEENLGIDASDWLY